MLTPKDILVNALVEALATGKTPEQIVAYQLELLQGYARLIGANLIALGDLEWRIPKGSCG